MLRCLARCICLVLRTDGRFSAFYLNDVETARAFTLSYAMVMTAAYLHRIQNGYRRDSKEIILEATNFAKFARVFNRWGHLSRCTIRLFLQVQIFARHIFEIARQMFGSPRSQLLICYHSSSESRLVDRRMKLVTLRCDTTTSAAAKLLTDLEGRKRSGAHGWCAHLHGQRAGGGGR
jgi:hypothetical protein